jgi:hypothetical protein
MLAGIKPTPAELILEAQAAIASCSGPTLLILDANGDDLGLAWVQYEVWCTAELRGPDSLFCLSPQVRRGGEGWRGHSYIDGGGGVTV